MSQLMQIPRAGAIAHEFTDSSDDQIVTIYTAGTSTEAQAMKADPNYAGMIGLLSDLRCFASVTSLTEVALPTFELEDDQVTRTVKVLDVQWKSPRKQLEFYMQPPGGSWLRIGAVAILNSGGYPYTTINLLGLITDDTAYELPDGVSIGLKLQDVGTGLLSAGDSITIYGRYTEEFTIKEATASVGNITTPDLTSVESDIQALLNQVSTLQTTINAVQSDLADDPELSDIQALDTKLNQLLAGGEVAASTTKQSGIVPVGTTDGALIGADTTNQRIAIILHNNSSIPVSIQYGAETGGDFEQSFELDPGSGVNERSWKGEIRAKVASGTADVSVLEMLP